MKTSIHAGGESKHMSDFGTLTSATVKCAKCEQPLGATGIFYVNGFEWFHSWCFTPTPDPRDRVIEAARAIANVHLRKCCCEICESLRSLDAKTE
jgi:hypothetical protein